MVSDPLDQTVSVFGVRTATATEDGSYVWTSDAVNTYWSEQQTKAITCPWTHAELIEYVGQVCEEYVRLVDENEEIPVSKLRNLATTVLPNIPGLKVAVRDELGWGWELLGHGQLVFDDEATSFTFTGDNITFIGPSTVY